MAKLNRLSAALITCLLLGAGPATLAAGDPEAGQAKAAACAGCHGPNGASAVAQFPKLAGQHESYSVGQLKAFKSGERSNPMMTGMSAALSEQDMADIGAFFAKQPPNIGKANPGLAELGAKIYRGGNNKTGVSACMACHGPDGAGNAPAQYPQLSGQHAAYVATRLKAYQAGNGGKGTRAKMMQDIAARLSEKEIQAVSSYVEGLH